MLHLQSNQRLYISEDLLGYVDKLIDDGTIPYVVDFLKLGFAYAVTNELPPATKFSRHEITDNTDILGKAKHVMEATSQWYARKLEWDTLEDSTELLRFTCNTGIAGGRRLKDEWRTRSKTQVLSEIIKISE